MEELVAEKDRIEAKLQKLKSLECDNELKIDENISAAKELTRRYNAKLKEFETLKGTYKAKLQQFEILKGLVQEYQRSQRDMLVKKFRTQIAESASALNELSFPLKLSVFKKFDAIRQIDTEKFANLDRKKKIMYNDRRCELMHRLLEKMEMMMGDKEAISEFIFYMNFLARFEIYFEEFVFINFLLSIIKRKFEYHFRSSRSSNRLDKPEWMFEFLLTKYSEMQQIYKIYEDCARRAGGSPAGYGELIQDSQSLLHEKIVDLARTSSSQKTKLIQHFGSEFIKFSSAVHSTFGISISFDALSRLLENTQRVYVESELQRIAELPYVKWFKEYQALCQDFMLYTIKIGPLTPTYRLNDVVKLIILHLRVFIDHLRFVSHDEILVLCFIYTEVIELKTHITSTEEGLLLEVDSGAFDDLTVGSITQLNVFIGSVLKLLKSLAVGEATTLVGKLSYFNYVSKETQRNTIVGIHNLVDTFGKCLDYKKIEPSVVAAIDSFMLNEIILRIRFTSEEYFGFREYLGNIKGYFKIKSWECDKACEALDALFDCRKISSGMYDQLEAFYNG